MMPRSVSSRALALAVPAAAIISALIAPGLAGAAVTPTGVTDTIHIEIVKGALKFVAPKTVTQGDELEIVNETNPKQVGPHTFSLVTKGSLPKTGPARKNCFTPKHICLSVAKWQGFNAKEEVTINPSEAGPAGWSTMGSLTRKGDSWFTGLKKGSTFTQPVTASTGTLYFMCAVHPWMQGKVTVVAPPVGVPGV
jgi:plastocyanin